jgi:hypothetical protein
MLHYSQAKKNKNQNDDETLSELYLYIDHKIAKNLSMHLSEETRAELDDNIYLKRRHFRHTIKRLRHNLHYSNWLKNVPEKERAHEQIRLRSLRG